MSYLVDKKGFYGSFGGAFIPEMLHPNIEELQSCYRTILEDPSFQKELNTLLRDYVGRPTPLTHAHRLSEVLGYQVWLKREDLNHTGAHKINNALGQALLARRLGKTRIIAETGAGQHGVATATACALLGFECFVYMGKIDMERQAPNVQRMRMLGAQVVPVTSGSQVLKDAANEAMRDWIAHPEETHYIIGSVVGPHPFPDLVAQFQRVIGQEIRIQLQDKMGSPLPHTIVACVGGGSNAIGAFFDFLEDEDVQLIGVEAAGEGLQSGRTAATIATGSQGILHGSQTLVMQTPDGQIVEAHSISAGLDYPGIGPQHALLAQSGRVQYVSVTDAEAIAAGRQLARLEGIIPALETAHALAHLPHIKAQPDDCVILNLSGRGDKDMANYHSVVQGGSHV